MIKIQKSKSRAYDIIIYGVTGFTGKLVFKYMLHNYVFNGKVKLAIAGRNSKKLGKLKETLTNELKTDNEIIKHYKPNLKKEKLKEYAQLIKDLPVVICDSSKEKTVDAMTKSTKVLITTVGPFMKYGKSVVKYCVENSCHYVDITGEVCFASENIQKYHKKAIKNKVNIVSMCGYDSIPSDLGTFMMQDYLKKKLKKNAYFIKECVKVRGTASGGTVQTLFNMAESGEPLLPGVFELNSDKKKKVSWEEKDTKGLAWNSIMQKYEYPFVMAVPNTRVVRRSAELLNYSKSFKYNQVALGSWMQAFSFVCGGAVFGSMVAWAWPRAFLKYWAPKAGTGSSMKDLNTHFFFHTFLAFDKDNKLICKGEVRGKDPGYLETSKMVSEAAICLVMDNVISEGGINTPAAAFGQHLIDRLNQANIVFKIVEKK